MGIYSMNRISICFSRANFAKLTTSSSLVPLMQTVFNLILWNPAFMPASMPSRVCSNPSLLQRSLNRSGSKVSRLIVMRFKPACFKATAWLFSNIPLVVRLRSLISFICDRNPTKVERSLRRRGSPPVSLTLLTPRVTAIFTKAVISSKERSSLLSRN